MTPSEQYDIPTIALLSSATASDDAVTGQAHDVVGGQSLLEYQISLLARLGIRRFYVEVDNVTGLLLALADKSRNKGRQVEFVRSGLDVQRSIQPDDRLWVQSEALYVAPELLKQLLKRPGTFVATIDGREDNHAFERIDLNTRWAGIAMVSAGTISALHSLPEGWSMTSSLLRQALQEKVPFCPLHQQHVQNGQIRIVQSAEDIGILNRQILIDRTDDRGGFIETSVLGPLAARAAPVIWRTAYGTRLVGGASVFMAASSVGLGAYGFYMSAIVSAMVAIILNILRDTVIESDDDSAFSKVGPIATWMLLGLAALVTARTDLSYSSDGMFAVINVIGLAMLAQKLTLPIWAEKVLKSPALLTVLALATTPVGGFAQAMQWIGIGQLGALIVAKWRGNIRKK
jgi:hypothetical protein